MSRILHQAAHSIALAINFVFCGEYDEVFIAKTAAREVTVYAEAFLRIGSMVVHITEDVALDESDLDEGVAFAASTAYYIYVCIPESGSSPEYAISTRDTYPTGWTDETSRIVGGFTTDGAGDIDVSTLWDLYEKGVWIAEAIGTAKGDLIVFTSAGVPARLGIGGDGQVLKADSAQPLGAKWDDEAGGHDQNTDTGTTSGTFQIDSGDSGPKLKNSSGELQARNAADDAYSDIRGKKISPEDLLDLSAAAAGQIKFPASQNASADANTLDDYEEGTWTPTLGVEAGGSGSISSYSAQRGHYVKIGRVVHVGWYIILSNKGDLSGNIHVAGLPFAMTNNVVVSPIRASSLADDYVDVYQVVGGGISTSGIYRVSATSGSPVLLAATNLTNTSVLSGVFSYLTS